ncbi:MAG: acetate--CoA ligase family protein [Thermoplasmata archaeon]
MTIVPEFEFKNKIRELGFSLPRGFLVNRVEDYRGNFPAVAKISSDKITHKSEIGALIVDIKGPEELRESINSLRTKFPGEPIYVEEMARRGIEVIIGLLNDEKFGKLILFGIGGFYSELIKDVTFKKLPLDREDASDMINELRYRNIFSGYRGLRTSEDIIVNLLLKISETWKGENFQQVDFNPVFLYSDSYLIVDAKMII